MVVIALKTVLWRTLLWCIACIIFIAVAGIAAFIMGKRDFDVKTELREILIYGIGGGLVVSIISTAVWL